MANINGSRMIDGFSFWTEARQSGNDYWGRFHITGAPGEDGELVHPYSKELPEPAKTLSEAMDQAQGYVEALIRTGALSALVANLERKQK